MSKVSPDVFLSQNGISSDHLPSNDPRVIVAALVALSATRHIDEETGKLVDTVYETPGFVATPISSASFSPENVKAEEKAREHFEDAKKTGDLAKVHAALDAYNKAAMASGGQEPKVCPSDFDILCHGTGMTAQFGRVIASLRVALTEIPDDSNFDTVSTSDFPAHNVLHLVMFGGEPKRNADGDLVGWFDTLEAFNALAAYGG